MQASKKTGESTMTQVHGLRFKNNALPHYVFLGLILWAGFWVKQNLDKMESAGVAPPPQARVQISPGLLTLMSFGHLPAVVDSYWIGFSTDAGLDWMKNGAHAKGYYALDTLTQLDPWFIEAYSWGGVMTFVVRDDRPGAITLLDRGLSHYQNHISELPPGSLQNRWKQGWLLPATRGYLALFESGDMDEAMRYYSLLNEFEGVPPYLLRLAEKLKDPLKRLELGAQIIRVWIQSAKDPEIKKKLEERWLSLQIESVLAQVQIKFDEFIKTRKIRGDSSNAWPQFLAKFPTLARDPLGGVLSIDDQGRVQTSTSYIKSKVSLKNTSDEKRGTP